VKRISCFETRQAARGRKQALLFLEKKEAKKLSFTAGCGAFRANSHRTESFLLLFFKKEALSYLPGTK
jgi:hypothetical protein